MKGWHATASIATCRAEKSCLSILTLPTLSCQEQVSFTLVLDMLLSGIPKEDRSKFRDAVKTDVAGAIAGNVDKVVVESMIAGSIIFNMSLLPGVCGHDRSAIEAALDLKG